MEPKKQISKVLSELSSTYILTEHHCSIEFLSNVKVFVAWEQWTHKYKSQGVLSAVKRKSDGWYF